MENPTSLTQIIRHFNNQLRQTEAAVRREVFEESGIKVGHVSYLASQPWAFPNSLMIGCHGEALSKEINLDVNEIDDALWISKTELMNTFDSKETLIRPARLGSIAQFLLKHWLADTLK